MAALVVAAVAAPVSARPRAPMSPKEARVEQIDAAVTAVVRRVERLPADAAGTEQLALDLERIHTQASAALTRDLRVVAQYESVAEDVSKLPWYSLIRPFDRIVPLRDRIGALETVVMRLANLVARADGQLRDQEAGMMPWRLTRPKVGRSPTMPHAAAGSLTEPPVSSPKAAAHREAATAIAEPLLDPSGLCSNDQGLCGVP